METMETDTSIGSIRRILVGIDGSEHAAAALVTAIRLARALGAEVVAVHAIPPPAPAEYGFDLFPAVPAELDPAWREEIHRQFEQEWCRPLEEAGVRYRALERDGWPAAVLREVAEAEDADLVVVGRRGRGRVTELLLGSVSHELSHTCRRPVLLVTGPRERGQERNRAGAGRPPAG
jgi:nucleotide-binding universal stress UspA family protein